MRIFFLILFFSFSKTVLSDAKSFLNDYNFTIGFSNIEHNSVGEELDVEWQVKLANNDQEKWELDFSYDHTHVRKTNNYDNTQVTDTDVSTEFNFDVNNIWKYFGFTSHGSMEQQKENGQFETKYDISFAPIGIKADYPTSQKLNELSLSYLPLYNYYEIYAQNYDDADNLILQKQISRSIHHALRLNFNYELIPEKLNIVIETWYKKVTNINSEDVKQEGDIFTNSITFNYQIDKYFALSYTNFLNYDQRRELAQQLPTTERDNKMSFIFTWSGL